MSGYAGDVALPLGLLDDDVELPFGDTDPTPIAAGVEVDRLRAALAECLSWAEGRSTPNGSRVRAWRDLAGIPSAEAGLTPVEARDEGIARAAAKWTDEEAAAVDAAIAAVAGRALDRKRLGEDPELTTADVWAELGAGFPVTKGIAGRMLAAKSAGLIANTGRTTIAPLESTGPNHGQRLTVWRAL